MTKTRNQALSSCDGGCRRCPPAGQGVDPAAPSGWRLAVPAAGLFLGPLVLAVAGAGLAGPSQVGQFLGAVGGLIVGAGAAVTVAKLIVRRRGARSDGPKTRDLLPQETA